MTVPNGTDMPQPVSSVEAFRMRFEYAVDTHRILEQPELTAQIGLCIACYSALEAQMGWFLSKLLGVRSKVAIAMYSRLEGAQTVALRAAAKAALNGRDNELFNVIMVLVSGVKKQRDAMAHGVWHISRLVSDGLILVPGRLASDDALSVGVWEQTAHGKTHPQSMPPLDLDQMFIYRKPDFHRFRRDVNRVQVFLQAFWRHGPERTVAQERALLRREPVIQTILRERASKQR